MNMHKMQTHCMVVAAGVDILTNIAEAVFGRFNHDARLEG